MSMNIPPINENNFTLETKEDTVLITGSIMVKNPEMLIKPFFDKVSECVIKNGTKLITLDLTKLNFLNSNCIKTLAHWILSINNLPDSDQYSVRILYDSNNIWQDSIMSTFVFLNPKLISIEKIDMSLY